MNTKKKIQIVCFLPYPKDSVPGQRFRWEQWDNELKKKKIILKILYFTDLNFNKFRSNFLLSIIYFFYLYLIFFLKVLKNLKYKNFVIFRNSTLIGPPFVEFFLWLLGKNLIFDFDDAIYLGSENNENWFIKKFIRCDWKFKFIMKISSFVICGNQILMNYAKRYNQKSFVVPTSINLNKYKINKTKKFLRNRPLTIGWSGSLSTSKYIENFLPKLLKLQKKFFFKILLIGSKFNFNNQYIKCIPWDLNTEVKDIAKLDIGLMPLPNNLWTRGKCALKIIQYLSLGIPAIVSNVGINPLIIKNNFNGHIIKGKSWILFLKKIIFNRNFFYKIKKNCRLVVAKQYSSKIVCNILSDIFRKYIK